MACLIAIAALLPARAALAQHLRIDRGVRAAGLWCFPLATNAHEYLYVPATGHLGVDRSGGPEFSFMRYVENVKSKDGGSGAITEGTGGALLHFLALYDTPPETVRQAEKELKEITKDQDARLRGPIVFSAGRYMIVSSVAKVDAPPGQTGDGPPRKVVATGNAPVLEGQKLALSMELDKREAQILFNSFQMANPDISVVFEMQFEGTTPGYDATLVIDWSEVMKDEQVKAGAKLLWVGADVQRGLQRLLRTNAIKLTSRGEDASTEALLNTVYSKLIDLMFRRVEEPPPPAQQIGLIDAIAGALTGGKSPLGFGLSASYRLIEGEFKGHSVMNFNHESVVKRPAFIAFNIGNLYKRYGTNPSYFGAVNLTDPVYSQREVNVIVDGSLLKDFDQFINSVSVTVKKEHQNGKVNLGELVVDRNSFAEKANSFKHVYGFEGDTNREKWLAYQYRVNWSFREGGVLEGKWQDTRSSVINVLPPYERREITVMGDPDTLKKAGVRSALVQLKYNFFGETRSKRVLVKAGESPAEQKLELIQPRGEYGYDYTVTWYLNGGRQVTRPMSRDTSGLIFVDEVPAQ